jgi:hypothetical protein
MQSITLQTNDTIVVSGDILGRVQFAASAESDGGAARLAGPGILGVAEGSFGSSSNPASLVFATSAADGDAATNRIKISHEGDIVPIGGSYDIGQPGGYGFNHIYVSGVTIAGAFTLPTTDGSANQILKTDGSGAVSWGDAASGGSTITLTAGDGLSGGGDTSADRSFAVNVDDSTIEINSDTLRIKDDGVTSAKIGALTDLLRWEYPDKALDGNVASLGYLRAYDESGGYAGFGVSTSSFNIGTSGAINMRFITAGSERAIINTDGDFIFNEAGASVDFRVEGDTEQNLLFVDGSADKVGIGTDSPAGLLHIKGEYSAGAHMTFEDTSSSLKTRLYNGNSASVIAVDEGDAVDTSSFQISVDNATKATFGAAATTFDQNVTINSTNNQAIFGNSITVLNEGGADIDFRVEGDTDANLLFLDASKDSVLIGNSTDGSINSKLHVYEANKTNSTYSRTINVLGRAYSTTDGSYYHIGLNSRAEKYLSASTTDGGYAIGVNAVPVIYSPDGTNTLAELTAVRANMSINSAASNVTVTNAFDIKTIPSLQGTNNTVTNHYGLYLSDPGGGNTTVTNEYGVYQVSTDAKNYFGGTLDVRGAAVFNEGGADVDFRVEGDTDANLLFGDASTDRVGIGTSSPSKKLHVAGDLLIDDGSAIVLDANGLKITDDTVGATLDTNLDDAIVIGEGAKSYADKSINIANGRFSSDGDCQKITQILRGSTTNANIFYLSNHGSTAELLNSSGLFVAGTAFNSDHILLPDSSVFTFTIHVSCRKQSSNDSAAFIIKGAVRNSLGWTDADTMFNESNASSTRNYHLIDSPIIESFIDSGLAGVTATVTTSYLNPQTSNTLDNLWFGVEVKGLAGTNLRWSAMVDGILTTY